jgi:hypothetical protein
MVPLQAVTDVILRKWADLGEGVSSHDVIAAVLADAMASALQGACDRTCDPIAELKTGRIAPELVEYGARLRKPVAESGGPIPTAVLGVFRTVLQPIATRGIGSRLDDLWRLILLPAAGVPMPVVADLLREPRTPNSKERKKAKDSKYLWRLRARALCSLADEIAPLLPTRMAA